MRFIKGFFLDNGSVCAGGIVHIFLAAVLGLLERHGRVTVCFLIVAISDIPFIGEHIGYFSGFPFFLAILGGDASLGQNLCNFRCRHTVEIGMEDPSHGIGLGRILHKLLVFKSESVWCVTVYIDAKFHSFDNGEALILRNRFGFFLSDCGEGVEQHLIAEGLSIDTFFLKDYSDTEKFQLSHILQGFFYISCESGHRFCDDEVYLPTSVDTS